MGMWPAFRGGFERLPRFKFLGPLLGDLGLQRSFPALEPTASRLS